MVSNGAAEVKQKTNLIEKNFLLFFAYLATLHTAPRKKACWKKFLLFS
tara:strand:+ start:234 stop:377 length:144 start_codon:yes stop_codon:yes gene_type:complete